MAGNNPAFSRNPEFTRGTLATTQNISAEQLGEMYNRPSAPVHEPMTMEDTIVKTVVSFIVLVAGAGVGWITAEAVPGLWIGAALVALVLALVNIFKKKPSPALVLAYAAVEGIFIGGISHLYESVFSGVVVQAVVATLVVVGVTLALFASGKIRASKKATKVFMIAMVGYAVFSLVNLGIMLFGGAGGNPWGLRGEDIIPGVPWGLVIGIFVVILAAYSLVLDFDFIQKGVQNKAPKQYAWTGAFGIMLTVVWLYLELLRLFAILRD